MVRQDKITYLVTSFQNSDVELPNARNINAWVNHSTASLFSNNHFNNSDIGGVMNRNELYNTYMDSLLKMINEGDIFIANNMNRRIFHRLGIMPAGSLSEITSKMSEYIPYKKQALIYFNLQYIGERYCTPFEPECVNCTLNEICDFFNNKNEWSI